MRLPYELVCVCCLLSTAVVCCTLTLLEPTYWRASRAFLCHLSLPDRLIFRLPADQPCQKEQPPAHLFQIVL